ncbi:hypothetical protein GCM10010911_40090 [Paenibacillus nasutitermitis]|uniref:Uncharacterized protein n=1 Tax=Paenibacillus nasutitermitis TaxID=1652958 RepID=A0A916Z5X9_9BACL|nr:hypothetical protein GCM10010911_40090 [Paenibacillus nasutitermitis]
MEIDIFRQYTVFLTLIECMFPSKNDREEEYEWPEFFKIRNIKGQSVLLHIKVKSPHLQRTTHLKQEIQTPPYTWCFFAFKRGLALYRNLAL